MKPCVLWGYKAIFVHIPKTAGISIEKHFGKGHKGGLDKYHVFSWRLKNHLPELWNSYYTFAFVRNPWDRTISAFFWMDKATKNAVAHPLMKLNESHKYLRQFNNDIRAFVKYFYRHQKEVMNMDLHFIPQSYWLFDSYDKPIDIDFIGRFENLEEDFKIICKNIGAEYRGLPHKNKSNRGNYKDYYDERTKEMIYEIYKKEIDYLGYEF